MVVLLLSEQSGGGAEQNWPNGRQRVKTGSCKVANSEQNIFDVHKNGQSKCPSFHANNVVVLQKDSYLGG